MSRVFIGRLPMGVRPTDVDRFLRGYGTVRDITLKKGYGFVEFDDYRDAEDAIDDLNGKELLGERVTLELARGRRTSSSRGGGGGGGGFRQDRSGGRGGGQRGYSSSKPVWLDKYGPPVRTGYAAVVENLSSRTSWQDLKDYCRKVGKVTYADAHKRRVGEGIVEFSCREDLTDALSKLDDTELGGRRIRIYEDKGGSRDHHSSSRRSHSRSRSRSPRRRTRSPSGSRSRSRSPPAKRSRSPPAKRSRSPPAKRASRSRSHSKSRSRSYSRTPVKSHSRSRSPPAENVKEECHDTD